jgi:hypothetical protein
VKSIILLSPFLGQRMQLEKEFLFLSKTLTKTRSILSPNSPRVLRVDYTIVSIYSDNEEKKAILYTVTRIYAGFRHPDRMTPESSVRGGENISPVSVRQARYILPQIAKSIILALLS